MIRFFLVLLLSFSSLVLAKQSDIVITQQGNIFKDFTLDFYEDSSAALSFEKIKEIREFTTHSNRISKGYSDSAFWFKFNIKNATDTNVTYFIKFTENMVHELDCYITSENGDYIKHQQGVGYFSANNVNALQQPQFKINLRSGESKEVHIRMFSIYPNMTSLYLFDEKALNEYTLKYYIFYSLYIGAVLGLLLYNLFIYFFIKERSYLYYVLYGLAFLSWQLLLNGFYPFNTFRNTFSFYSSGMVAPIWVAFLIFFSVSILETKALFPKIDKGLKYTGFLFLLLALGTILSLQKSYIIINTLVTFVFPFLIYVGFKSYFSGNKAALFFIVAQISFISMSTLFSLLAYGHLDYHFIIRHGVVLGSFIEIILFSLALAYKIKVLQNEKLAIINQANTELDSKVKERTRELEESKEQLKELTYRDSLTNLYNRRFLYEISIELISIAKREKTALSVITFDIDKFKEINDTYGHNIGDEVIKTLARLLQNTRKSDVAVRVGGDEFVLLLPKSDENGAYNIASKIIENIEKHTIQVNAFMSLGFTVSGGISTFMFDSDYEIDHVLYRADKALYQAKTSGRNKIVIASME